MFFIFYFYFLFDFIWLYNTVLVLPYINMNLPRVYMCSQSWTPLPPPSPCHLSAPASAPAPSILYPASNLDWWFVSVSQYFTSGGQSIGASALVSVLAINIQAWFPLGMTGLISLQSKGLSRVISNSWKASVLWHSAFFIVQLSHP